MKQSRVKALAKEIVTEFKDGVLNVKKGSRLG